jgi:uncharacterized protein
MNDRMESNPDSICSPGTQVVVLRDVKGQGDRVLHPKGSVGVVLRSPRDLEHAYRVRFLDGVEEKPLAVRTGDADPLQTGEIR